MASIFFTEFDWLRDLQHWLGNYLDSFWVQAVMLVFNFLLLVAFMAVLDWLVRRVLQNMILVIVNRTKLNWDSVFYKNKVFRSLLHLIPISLAFNSIELIFKNQPQGAYVAERFLFILLIVIFVQLTYRIVNSFTEISRDDNNYTTIGIRTFGQLTKIIGIFMAVIALIAVLFDVSFTQILTVLGALTAVLILVFRDTILGFVSGVQISTTKMAKIGDWIKVSKYNVEGYVREINLTTVKIEKFDKTLAMVPTYDLISSNITNYRPMVETKTRRIKRAIFFNIKSFKFLNNEQLNHLKTIELLAPYIHQKQNQIIQENTEKPSYKRQLTNIGLFRKYAEEYLASNSKISKKDMILVRQLDVTPNGLPLEIYCFTNTAVWQEYEQAQADVFDHLLTKTKEFDLEVMQTIEI